MTLSGVAKADYSAIGYSTDWVVVLVLVGGGQYCVGVGQCEVKRLKAFSLVTRRPSFRDNFSFGMKRENGEGTNSGRWRMTGTDADVIMTFVQAKPAVRDGDWKGSSRREGDGEKRGTIKRLGTKEAEGSG